MQPSYELPYSGVYSGIILWLRVIIKLVINNKNRANHLKEHSLVLKHDQFNVQAEKLWQISPYFFISSLLVEANKAASGTCYVIIRVKLIWISQLCIVQRTFLSFV